MEATLKKPLRGIVPPLVTPLVNDELDEDGLQRLLDRLLVGGVHGLFILGTTGEGPSLSYHVRRTMMDSVCSTISGRLPVLVGVTDTSLTESIDMARCAEAAGADAIVFAPPCYFPISQHELTEAVRRLANESPLPVIAYNMPALTKTSFEIDTIRSLMDEPNVIGFKDSSGDMDYFRQLRAATKSRGDWSIMTGPEHLLAQAVSLGGDGGVCGGANVCPELFVQLFESSVAGDASTSEDLQKRVELLGELYALSTSGGMGVIQGIKAALAHLGVCSEQLCSPCSALPETHREAVGQIMDRLGIQQSPAIVDATAQSA